MSAGALRWGVAATLLGALACSSGAGGACWGMKVKTSDADSASPKYQGLLDWLAAHP
jgi:hypothetical protein